MGRRKTELKKIEDKSRRRITFCKRRVGLMKKASELSVLCDAEVAIIIFSDSGKLYQFSSSDMKGTLSRYNECPEATLEEHETQKEGSLMVETLRHEIANLETKQLWMLGKDLTGLSIEELQTQDKQLQEGLLSVKERKKEETRMLETKRDENANLERKQLRLYDKDLSGLSLRELQSREKHLNEQLLYVKEQKEEMLMDKIEQCRVQEQRAMLENEYLRTQVKELHSLLSVSEHGVPSYLQYDNMERSRSFLFTGASSSNLAINEHGGSEKTLDLGFPTDIDQKGKVPAKETSSNDSENAKL